MCTAGPREPLALQCSPMPDGPQDRRDDVELMQAVAQGDRQAFAVLMRRHQGLVMGLARRYLGAWDLAEDVTQDTFLRVYRSADSYRPTARFTTWLCRIAVNLCRDHARKKRDEQTAPDDLPDLSIAGTSDDLQRAERARAVRRAVDALPDRQRLAVILHRYSGMSHAEIADITGWTLSAVESCLVRAYAGLRKSLADFSES